MYSHDQEIMKLVQTKQQLQEKIALGPEAHELQYAIQHEQLHYAKRNQVKTLCDQLNHAARDHKLRQDEQIRRNNNVRGQLQTLRRQLLEA